MDAVTILKSARALLDRPYAFTKDTMHRERMVKGHRIDCYCAVGALRKVVTGDPGAAGHHIDGYSDAVYSLCQTIRPDGSFSAESTITTFNDRHRKSEVLALFDTTIARLENS